MEQLDLTPQEQRTTPATETVSGTGEGGGSPAPEANVTEIILPEEQIENFQLLLPMLTQLNQEERWLAWIDPPAGLVGKWQQHHGIIQHQLLILRSSAQHSAETLAEKALSAGTCHAVVLWTSGLSRHSYGRLENASVRGHSHGVILRQRQTRSQ
ncbi:LexA family transcriptional regulator [Halovibrio salipaludis]|uniref:LexA family transcriptional regulator n=1 Tax=Halovibrio salipaludis TaxID=2032626 RepID=A0A2A2F9R4_9GAMM|nr:SulA-like leucine-rich domain-containing protein [Halovibrio salipaludis]PAU81369.1 LexA family transcriptional regulator [Halovibrio salipaludis]